MGEDHSIKMLVGIRGSQDTLASVLLADPGSKQLDHSAELALRL